MTKIKKDTPASAYPPPSPSKPQSQSLVSTVAFSTLIGLVAGGAVAAGMYFYTHRIIIIAAAAGGTTLVAGSLSFIIIRNLKKKEPIAKESEPQTKDSSTPRAQMLDNEPSHGNKKMEFPSLPPEEIKDTPQNQNDNKAIEVTPLYIKELAEGKKELPPRNTHFSDLTTPSRLVDSKQMEMRKVHRLEILQQVLIIRSSLPKGTNTETLVEEFLETLFDAVADFEFGDIKPFIRPYFRYLPKDLLKLIYEKGLSEKYTTRNHIFTLKKYFTSLRRGVSFFESYLSKSPNLDCLSNDRDAEKIASNLILENAIRDRFSRSNLERFGIAIDTGFCFYHSCAQVISVALGRSVTTVEIAQKILQFIDSNIREHNDNGAHFIEEYLNHQNGNLKNGAFKTIEEYKEHLSRLAAGEDVSNSWGDHFLECAILSKIYNVQFEIIEVAHPSKIVSRIEVQSSYSDNDFILEEERDSPSSSEPESESEHKSESESEPKLESETGAEMNGIEEDFSSTSSKASESESEMESSNSEIQDAYYTFKPVISEEIEVPDLTGKPIIIPMLYPEALSSPLPLVKIAIFSRHYFPILPFPNRK